MSDPQLPQAQQVNYEFTTFVPLPQTSGRDTITVAGAFSPEPPRNSTTGKHVLNVGDTVTFKFRPVDATQTVNVTASAFIAMCKGEVKENQPNPMGIAKYVCPVDGVQMVMSEDSLGFWGFTISFTAEFVDTNGNVIQTHFYYLPDPEVDIETGGGG